jgi:hypothetical protein
MEKLPDIIVPSLKITFNTPRKIQSISSYYYHQNKPDIKTEVHFITSNNSDNKLDLLIEPVKFIETYNDKLKVDT